jgi:putative hydrolase of the HAD superfamily
MNIKLVSFDVWDTLLRLDVFFKTTSRILSEQNSIDQEKAFKKLIEAYKKAKSLRRNDVLGKNVVSASTKIVSETLGIEEEGVRRTIAKAVVETNPEELIIEGARTTLKEVRELNIKIATLGNVLFWPGSYTRILLERTGLSNYINLQLYADEIELQKPQREAFEFLLKQFLVKPEEAMHVGDGLHEDFAGAIISGLVAVVVVPNLSSVVKLGERAFAIPSISYVRRILNSLS